MSNITDKELLTFCNLANLEMEYADLGKVRDIKTNEILVNHTIYSLLEKEINSFENKRKFFEIEKKEPKTREERLIANHHQTHREEWSEKIKSEENRKKEKVQKIKNGEFGVFVDIQENEFMYMDIEKLRRKAPILMEYYDRYNISAEENKTTHEGAFLKEWEIINAYDQYNISKEFVDGLNLKEPKIPTRKEVIEGEKIQKILEFVIEKLGDTLVVLSFVGLNPRGYLTMAKIVKNEAVGEILNEATGLHGDNLLLAPFQKYKEQSYKKIVLAKGNLEISFKDSHFKYMTLKKDKIYVIVIASSDYNYNIIPQKANIKEINEKFPDAFYTIRRRVEILKKSLKEDEKIILTGTYGAGYLAQLMALSLNLEYRIFIDEKLFYPVKKISTEEIKGIGVPEFFKIKELITNQDAIKEFSISEASIFTCFIVGSLVKEATTGVLGYIGGVATGWQGLLVLSLIYFYRLGGKLKENYDFEKFVNNLKKIGIIQNEYVKNLPKMVNLSNISKNFNKEVSLSVYLDILYLVEIENFNTTPLHNNKVHLYKINMDCREFINITFTDNEYEIEKAVQGDTSFDDPYFKELEYKKEKPYKIGKALEEILNINYLINKNYSPQSCYVITGKGKEELSEKNDKKLESKYFYIENRVPKNEYLFFPFINKYEGTIQNELRNEYIKSQLRSIATSNGYPQKYSKENIIEGVDEDWTFLGDSYEDVKERLMEKLEKEETSREYPYLDLVKEDINKYGLDFYLTKTNIFSCPFTIIGICNKDGVYLNDEIGFIYEKEGKLRGRVVEVLLSEDKEVPKISPIVDGVKLKCNFGSQPSEIKITSHNVCYTDGSLIGTKKDSKAFENIHPFGKCLCTSKECSLNIIGDWEETNKEMAVGENEIILTTSKLRCQKGGVITFLDQDVKVMKFKGMTSDIDGIK